VGTGRPFSSMLRLSSVSEFITLFRLRRRKLRNSWNYFLSGVQDSSSLKPGGVELEHSLETENCRVDASNLEHNNFDLGLPLGWVQSRRLRLDTMAEQAEVWIRKSRRMIHNQLLIQLFAVLAITLPLLFAALMFWTTFGIASPIVIQSLLGLWTATTVVYVASSIYVRTKQRET
jgi:hypothetical protein